MEPRRNYVMVALLAILVAGSLAVSAAGLMLAYNRAKNSSSKAHEELSESLDELQQQADAATNKLKNGAAAKRQDAISMAQSAATTYLPRLKQSFDTFLQEAKGTGRQH
jgi:hypothetical protein